MDLDPDKNLGFEVVKETKWALKIFLEKYEFTPFIKTSGGKGFHVIVPIKPISDYDKITAGLKKLEAIYVKTYRNTIRSTLAKGIEKEKF